MRMLALALTGTLAWGQPVEGSRDELLKLPGLLWDDAKAVAQAPGQWTAAQWQGAGWAAAAVLGTAAVLDRPLSRAAARNRTPGRDRTAGDVAQLGGTGGLALLGAGYAGSSLLGRDEVRSTVVDMGLATLLAQVAILPLKYGIGRARPADGLGGHHFAPMTRADAFPSGHATQAFAMASALSLRSSEPWVGWCAYGAAGLVGLSRLETRDHYASDVVAGALVGTVLGRAVVRLNREFRSPGGKVRLSCTPMLAAGSQGLALRAVF